MKKLLFVSLMIISLNGYCAVSPVIIGASVAASTSAANSARQSRMKQEANTSRIEPVIFTGMLVCDANKKKTPDGDNVYEGCSLPGWGRGSLSFEDYFERNRPNKQAIITGIIFDRYNEEFQIYYQY